MSKTYGPRFRRHQVIGDVSTPEKDDDAKPKRTQRQTEDPDAESEEE